ncbi:enoyl-CoA hydratase [Talaromyces islandicus]|uniref:Enoyl-CoA hydratase n=1 Tax=Talaromyces islandicus TaxID=28573 RepID=A0A0U1M8R7_TALIS|nr:enoyl-CoA hydratase [Talaromyces islandicus]
MANSTAIPESYSSLPVKDILISHVPETCLSPTVVLLQLNRPKKLNAVTAQMIEELVTAYHYFELDDRVKAIVVTGVGKGFCVGADLGVGFSGLLENLKGGPPAINAYRDGGGRVALAIHNCPTIRVVSANSKIGFAFSRRGLVMEACSSYFLPRLLGLSRALHLVTTGGTYAASDPLLAQLFSEVLPTPEETVSRAIEIANEIAAHTSTVSTAVMHDLMCRGPSTPEEAHLLESRIFLTTLLSRDSKEGMASFLEKRNPRFTGTMRKDAPQGWPWWQTTDTTSHIGENKTKL